MRGVAPSRSLLFPYMYCFSLYTLHQQFDFSFPSTALTHATNSFRRFRAPHLSAYLQDNSATKLRKKGRKDVRPLSGGPKPFGCDVLIDICYDNCVINSVLAPK